MANTDVATQAGKPTSRREQAKLERKQKILASARRNIAQYGFDRATLRQVAAEAGITVSALFKHVTDKRDLIHFLFNEDLDGLTDRALAAWQPEQSFAEKVLSITEHHYRHFAKDPMLSRVLLSEILVSAPGLHLERNLEIRARLIHGLESLVAEAQRRGELTPVETPERIALQIFWIHAASLRQWLGSSPSPGWRKGHRDYERSLRLQLRAFLVNRDAA